MSVFTGPNTEIYPDTTIPGTSAVAMTAFRAKGNSVRLQVTTTTGGCGSLTFTAEEREPIDGSTYKDVIDRDSVWSFVCTTPDTAGSYSFDLEGLHTVPGVYYRLSYQAATAAGKLQVDVLNWENPKGGAPTVSVGDVVVDVDNIDVNIEAVEQIHDAAVGASGFMQVVEAKTVDGSALPNAVSEGDVVRPAAEKTGNLLVTQVDADGSDAATITEDAAKGGGIGTAVVMAGHTVADFDGSAIPALGDTQGDAASAAVSSEGVAFTQITTEDGASTPVIAHDAAIAGATGGNVGVMTMMESADVDGSAIPNAVGAEGDGVRPKASLSGVALTATVSEDGSYIQPTGDAVGRSVYTAIGDATTTAVVETAGTKKALHVNVTYGTNDMPTMDANTRAGYITITDGTTDATVDATTAGLDTNIEGIGGEAVGDHATAVIDHGLQPLLEAKDIDGSAVPNVVTEGQAARQASTLSGAALVTMVNEAATEDVGATLAASVIVDDAAFTPATDSVTMAGFEYDDTTPDSVDEGDAGAARMSANRNQYMQIRDAAGNERGVNVDASNQLAVYDADAVTALQIMDDWDESDRAKVNPIAGQAGIAANAGIMDALTTRVTLATDDTHMGAVGAASDIDGVVHGQLRYLGDYLTTIDSDTNTIQSDTTSIDGKTPSLGNANMAGSVPVTLASDDTNTVDIPNVIGTDGAAGPTKTLSVAGTESGGNIQELRVDSDGHLQVDALTVAQPTLDRVVTNATGSGSGTLATTAHSAAADLKNITILLGGALAAGETITVTLDANDGVAYDAVLRSYDMGTAGTTSWSWVPEVPIPLESGDEIIVALSANTNTRTYGLRIVADKV